MYDFLAEAGLPAGGFSTFFVCSWSGDRGGWREEEEVHQNVSEVVGDDHRKAKNARRGKQVVK
jgi:hypothetical protein